MSLLQSIYYDDILGGGDTKDVSNFCVVDRVCFNPLLDTSTITVHINFNEPGHPQ